MISSLDFIIILLISLTMDWILGDPHNKIHPVAWLGKYINYFIPKIKNEKKRNYEKKNGIIFTTVTITFFAILIQSILVYLYNINMILMMVLSIFILYSVIAIKGMEKHINAITIALQNNDIENARKNLSMIVSRNTKNLDEQHILSGAIESIADGIVDGILSPLFYFSILGSTGAFIFRLINTLDSMIGYKEKYFEKIGWMAAKADTYANYIPARITAVLMIFAAIISKADWKNSIDIFKKERNHTISINSGHPISILAGALRIRLEKIDHYTIGEPLEKISIEKCKMAIKIMKITILVFCMIIAIPIILIMGYLNWWNFLFGI
ncbi:MAG TPA: cobalamin biosynthesis protein [Nitrososphaeraceae archaeon]|nr:cobalamin biosynthesis protein [Nitrososphaeraceae archaeon]